MLLRARQRLLRCRRMTNSPPPVQASGGLPLLWVVVRVTRTAGTPREVECALVHQSSNHSIERTATDKPASAAHVKRWAKCNG